MAIVCSMVSQLAATANTNVYNCAGFTPLSNAKLIAFVYASGTVSVGSFQGGGLSWTQVARQLMSGAADGAFIFAADTGGSPGVNTPTFNCSDDNATGALVACYQLSGSEVDPTSHAFMSPMSSIRQVQTAAASNTGRSITFSLSVMSGNAVILSTGGLAAPTGTAPSNFTQTLNNSWTTPSGGFALAHRNSGETGSTFVYSSAAAAGAVMGVEIWATGQIPSGDPCGMSGVFGY